MISNLPIGLQSAIQQNLLATYFEKSLQSLLMYRTVAHREKFPIHGGESLTRTRMGLKAPVTTPLDPSKNTNLDNGLTPSSPSVEQYNMTINGYGDTLDLNINTTQVMIADLGMQYARINGVQAAQTMDRLARNNLFGAYMGGNTRVTATLGSAGVTVAVDDVRGFQQVLDASGKIQPISGSNTMPVMIGANIYTLISWAADAVNTSSTRYFYDANGAPNSGTGGISGTLTFSSAVTVADATLGNAVIAGYAPVILRPNGRATTGSITTGDNLTMSLALDAVALLRNNAVPTIDGKYHMFADPQSLRQLFSDPEFQLLFRGRGMADPVYSTANVYEGLDIRFFSTTEAPQQLQSGTTGRAIRRPIVCGADVIIEGTYQGMEESVANDIQDGGYMEIIDDVLQVVRPPLDRFKQICAMSWMWEGGYAVPTDATANRSIIPTASNAYLKRAVILETA